MQVRKCDNRNRDNETVYRKAVKIPKVLAPAAMTDNAERAGSLVIRRCHAIDSLFDVLKRFPALCS